jgi:hypothetical protein
VTGSLQVTAVGVVQEDVGGLTGLSVPIPWAHSTSTLGEPPLAQFHFDQEQTAEARGCGEVKDDVDLSPVLLLTRVVGDDGPPPGKFGEVVAGSVVLKTNALYLDRSPEFRGEEGLKHCPSS